MQAAAGKKRKGLGDREYYRRKTGQTWPKRKIHQLKHTVRSVWWKRSELMRFGHTLWEKRVGGVTKFY